MFALLVLRATCGCCTRAHQGSAVVMLSPSRLDLDPSGPRPAALSTVAHYEKTYRAPQRTNLLDSESNVGKLYYKATANTALVRAQLSLLR